MKIIPLTIKQTAISFSFTSDIFRLGSMRYNFTLERDNRIFIEKLKSELTSVLPGVEAHLRLAPEMRVNDLKTSIPPAHALESAVLIILFPSNGQLHTVVILRNEYDGAHSGQISLPGGKKEISDIDFKHTALREAQEEIGIIPADMEIVGQLSRFYVKPSNFIIYPFVAYTPVRPEFRPDPIEVQKVIEIDIFREISYDLMIKRSLMFRNNIEITAPGFIVDSEFMWGATAMIFSELLHILSRVADE
jgi:8-oxo-dGTP pyrophosphatase MutT (NUDIX family)